MVVVLAAVLVMAASIWIAIFLEARLGMLPARATLARASQPASCRFRSGAARSAVSRPVRCTQGVRAEVVNLRERGQLFRAVGDPQQRPAGRALQHRLEHGVGRGRVEVPGRFVQKQHGAVGQHGPGHAEALQLSAGDRMVPGREHGIEALLEPVQPRAEAELVEEVGHLPVGDVRRADSQVHAQRRGEQRRLLGTPGQQSPDLPG